MILSWRFGFIGPKLLGQQRSGGDSDRNTRSTSYLRVGSIRCTIFFYMCFDFYDLIKHGHAMRIEATATYQVERYGIGPGRTCKPRMARIPAITCFSIRVSEPRSAVQSSHFAQIEVCSIAAALIALTEQTRGLRDTNNAVSPTLIKKGLISRFQVLVFR